MGLKLNSASGSITLEAQNTAGDVTLTIPSTSGAVLTELIEDTTPQLGGNLDTQSYTVDGRDISTDGTKLDGIATSANNYTHPTGAGNEHLPSSVSQTEAGYLDGVTSAIQTQLGTKLASGGTLATATITTLTSTTTTATTANITTVDLGNWTITESAGVLYFKSLGVNKMKLDASGNLTVAGDITAYGTI